MAGWDPDAIERVRQEVRPEPRDADELHDLPMTVVGLRPIQDWRRWLDELVEEHRALTVYGPRRSGAPWIGCGRKGTRRVPALRRGRRDEDRVG